jgi:hypothetical protein
MISEALLYQISPTVGLLGGVVLVVLRIPPPTTVPPILTEPPIPTPPATVNAPVEVLVLDVVLVMLRYVVAVT